MPDRNKQIILQKAGLRTCFFILNGARPLRAEALRGPAVRGKVQAAQQFLLEYKILLKLSFSCPHAA